MDSSPGGATRQADANDVESSTHGATYAAPDATNEADAAAGPDVTSPPVTDNEVCHVQWAQAPNFLVDRAQLSVDGSGNALVAISYDPGAPDAGPPIVLGAAQFPYADGFVVAKLDPECDLLWARDFGSTRDASRVVSRAMGVDSAGNVTVAGDFTVPADLGAGVVDPETYGADGGGGGAAFLLRLDPSGNVLFSKVFPAEGGSLTVDALAVEPDGSSTLVASLASGVDFGAGLVATSDPQSTFVAHFDATGSVTSTSVGWLGSVPIAPAPNGGVWTIGLPSLDASVGLGAFLMRLDAAGEPVWSRPVPVESDPTFAVNRSSEAVFSKSYDGEWVRETVTTYSQDGTQTATHDTVLDGYLWGDLWPVVLDPAGDTIVGETFLRSWPLPNEGARARPVLGAGFQRFAPSGALESVTAWGGQNTYLESLAVAPNGNVVVLGQIVQTTSDEGPQIVLVRFAP